MLTRSRARSIGWAMILAVCFGFTVALTFRVNAVKSQVRLAERQIIALRTEQGMLETEYETRANQQQLRALNDVEFGYEAPTAGQYLENERQLAAYGKPRAPGAPQMIRVAHNDVEGARQSGDSAFPAMVNPLTGALATARAMAAELPKDKVRAQEMRKTSSPAGLVERLSHIECTPRPLSVKTPISGKSSLAVDANLADRTKLAARTKLAGRAKLVDHE